MTFLQYHRILFLLLAVLPRLASAQTANLRLLTQLDCTTGQYSSTIQIQAGDPTSFSIGTSSVLLSYNPASLTFAGYESLNFDTNTPCNGPSLWDAHAFDTATPGFFNLTLNLNSTTLSCPRISNADWVSVGKITFRVLDPTSNPELLFNVANTSFNALPGNDGVVQIGTGQFTGVNRGGALICPAPCRRVCLPIVAQRTQ